ncbi:MAG: hypothetical protein FJY77_00130 [Candidatus Altiarchaeales archaeon]|nr:hypothetical protein [Candidatus Altiarchaeales archaeon]
MVVEVKRGGVGSQNQLVVDINPLKSHGSPVFQTLAVTREMARLVNENHMKGECGLLLFGTAGTITEFVEVPKGDESSLPSLLSKESEKVVRGKMAAGRDFIGVFHNHPGVAVAEGKPLSLDSLWPSQGDRFAYYDAFGTNLLDPAIPRDQVTMEKRWDLKANPLYMIGGKMPDGRVCIIAHEMKYRGGMLFTSEPRPLVELKA